MLPCWTIGMGSGFLYGLARADLDDYVGMLAVEDLHDPECICVGVTTCAVGGQPYCGQTHVDQRSGLCGDVQRVQAEGAEQHGGLRVSNCGSVFDIVNQVAAVEGRVFGLIQNGSTGEDESGRGAIG